MPPHPEEQPAEQQEAAHEDLDEQHDEDQEEAQMDIDKQHDEDQGGTRASRGTTC